MMLGDLRIIEAPHMTVREQVRFPKSRSRRIRKKWSRDPRNWSERPDPTIYFVNLESAFGGPAVMMHVAAIRNIGVTR